MPLKKKTKDKDIDRKAELGRKYFDILDIYVSKTLTTLSENSNENDLNRSHLKAIEKILNEEKIKARSWGFDQLAKVIKE